MGRTAMMALAMLASAVGADDAMAQTGICGVLFGGGPGIHSDPDYPAIECEGRRDAPFVVPGGLTGWAFYCNDRFPNMAAVISDTNSVTISEVFDAGPKKYSALLTNWGAGPATVDPVIWCYRSK